VLACTVPDPQAPPQIGHTDGADNQIVESTDLPYPVIGWMMMQWEHKRTLQLSPDARKAY